MIDPPSRVAPGNRVTIRRPAITDVIVLVAGTVDPVNNDSVKRAQSYESAAPPAAENSYWAQSQLIESLSQVCGAVPGATLFHAHGWSGDNAIINREIAGGYLAERFCSFTKSSPSSKAPDKEPYYKGLLKRAISFHLVGHSHGGNVINEFTKRIATLADWPDTWKVKSIVYLSTPFFTKLHKVNTSKFHAKARILSVYNEYDLTQRVVADFSMLPLPDVLGLVTARRPTLSRALDDIGSFRFEVMKDALESTRLRDVDPSWRVDPTWMMAPERGAALYQECRRVVGGIRDLLQVVTDMIDVLASSQPVFVLPELRGRIPDHRKILSDGVAARFRAALAPVALSLDGTLAAFDSRLASGEFPVGRFTSDWHVGSFLAALVDLLRLDPGTLSGKLTDLIADVLIDQMDVFDNTTNRVQPQLAGTPFAGSVDHEVITHKDPFDNDKHARERDRFIGFANHLEGCEARFNDSRGRPALLDLFFTLLAHMGGVHEALHAYREKEEYLDASIAYFHFILSSVPGADSFFSFVAELRHYVVAIRERNFGQLATSEQSQFGEISVGDVPYFVTVSHSLSHRLRIDRVFDFLASQMTSPAGQLQS
jgi:hypothetical protein